MCRKPEHDLFAEFTPLSRCSHVLRVLGEHLLVLLEQRFTVRSVSTDSQVCVAIAIRKDQKLYTVVAHLVAITHAY